MNNIKISIITATFNSAKTLPQTLKSISNQTYKNIEHIIVDGGSSDDSINIIKRYADNKKIFLSEPDEGLYFAINKGMELASGDVIGLMHSDDFYSDNFVLNDIARIFMNPRIDAVYADLDYINSSNQDQVVRKWRPGIFNVHRIKFGWMPPHPTLYIRNSCIEKFGLYDTQFRISSDYDFVLRYFSSVGFRAHYMPRVIVKMRLGGISNQSIKTVILKSYEDYLAIKKNKIGGFYTLAIKNLSKVHQYFIG